MTKSEIFRTVQNFIWDRRKVHLKKLEDLVLSNPDALELIIEAAEAATKNTETMRQTSMSYFASLKKGMGHV